MTMINNISAVPYKQTSTLKPAAFRTAVKSSLNTATVANAPKKGLLKAIGFAAIAVLACMKKPVAIIKNLIKKVKLPKIALPKLKMPAFMNKIAEMFAETSPKAKKVVGEVVENSKKVVSEVTDNSQKIAKEVSEGAKKITAKATEGTKKVVNEVIDTAKEVVNKVIDTVKNLVFKKNAQQKLALPQGKPQLALPPGK